MRLADLPLGVKLPLIVGGALFVFLLTLLLYTLALREVLSSHRHLLAGEITVRQRAQDLAIHLLQARRAEKDFLLRKELPLVEAVTRQIDEAVADANAITGLLPALGDVPDGGNPRQALGQLLAYRDAFASVARGHQKRGLDHDSGLQGAFRAAAHRLENLLPHLAAAYPKAGAATALEVAYLKLRRLEKDYLLRLDGTYAQQTQGAIDALEQQATALALPKEQLVELTQALVRYRTAFVSLVAEDGELEQAMTAMREAARRVEPVALALVKTAMHEAALAEDATQRFGEQAALLLLGVGLTVMGLVGSATWLIIRRIGADATALERYGKAVAQGDLDQPVPMLGEDEIGHLAGVLAEMANRMRLLRILADHMAVILVLLGRGAIPEPIQGQYPAEFQKICDGLNALITRLQELRVIAGHLRSINQGTVPTPLEGGHFTGEVGEIVTSLNGIIGKLRHIGGLPNT